MGNDSYWLEKILLFWMAASYATGFGAFNVIEWYGSCEKL